MEDGKGVGIKGWSPEDRPREKLLLKGTSSLSETELIAILIGSGTANFSAVEVARKIFQLGNNNLNDLARLTVKDLMKIKGIGEAKAITVVAALELGRRRKEISIEEKPKITISKDAFDQLKGDFMDLPHEEFWMLMLNRGHRVIKKERVSSGGVSGTVVDPKIIFKLALEERASGIVIAHNHPSGNMIASISDLELTRKLKDAGKLLEIQLLDHLIICNDKYLSFTDEGLL